MSISLKDDILKAVRDSYTCLAKTPRFRKPTAPPQYAPPPMPPVQPPKPPTSGSNAVKPKKPCTYETPCGWCTKWDKKCDRKPYKRGLRVEIDPVDDAMDPGLILEKI